MEGATIMSTKEGAVSMPMEGATIMSTTKVATRKLWLYAWLGAMVLVPGVLLSFSYYVTAFRGSVVAAHDGVALAA